MVLGQVTRPVYHERRHSSRPCNRGKEQVNYCGFRDAGALPSLLLSPILNLKAGNIGKVAEALLYILAVYTGLCEPFANPCGTTPRANALCGP